MRDGSGEVRYESWRQISLSSTYRGVKKGKKRVKKGYIVWVAVHYERRSIFILFQSFDKKHFEGDS